MTKNYSYPLDFTWSTEEISSVLSFLNQVELAYETRAEVKKVLQSYKAFKTVVKSKAEEKQIDKLFEKTSGYSSYKVLKLAQSQGEGFIKIEK
ncbi:MAG: UPF0223 family protein [Streptococcus sp.]|nr:UPF0223 family protein [Streptococcus sp.]